jgi:hypothetical protein
MLPTEETLEPGDQRAQETKIKEENKGKKVLILFYLFAWCVYMIY